MEYVKLVWSFLVDTNPPMGLVLLFGVVMCGVVWLFADMAAFCSPKPPCKKEENQ